ncbi:claspin-like [Salvia splendens]|uniref:claspin-like n=1 Tax=Salvia splendens TaxID=180675 RepID=UPI001C25973F|nr:claspin-like [Salvia splendens]
MDSDDDYQTFSPSKVQSPQLQLRRLKRLKKSDAKPLEDPLFDPNEDPILFDHVDFAKLEALENDSEPQVADESISTEDANLSQGSLSQGAGKEVQDPILFSHVDFAKLEALENDSEPQLADESFSTEEANLSQESPSQGIGNGLGIGVEVKKTKRVLEFDDDVVGGSPMREGSENLELEKKKEILGEDGLLEENEGKKKKKRRENSDEGDELEIKSWGSKKERDVLPKKSKRTEERDELPKKNKRTEEKERKEYLKELHAESQRLLRETSDASFKPIAAVHKPISSVLEKIRKRKLEISKKSMISNDSNHGFERNIRPRDKLMDLDVPNEDRSEENATIPVEKETNDPLEEQSSLAGSNVDEDDGKPTIHDNAQNEVPANEEPTPAPRAPVDDTQDLFDDSEPLDTTNVQNDEKPNNLLDEDFAPSLQAMNLKFDSVPMDDSSSDEEDNDKENSDPHPRVVADNSSPNGDPVKNFIDEEAEEEDDSDNDLNRFPENEGDDNDDLEELNAMIATGYEERLTDKERRNELHQKWLEQQDAAGTDNLIQRLKCGPVVRDNLLLDDEPETDEDDEKDEEIDDEAEEGSFQKESSRVNIKMAKQIILKLYPDKEDAYVSDGDEDEDMQRKRAQCLIRKEERATIASPAADASSREVFGLIKKLNISSDNNRKPKALSVFDSILKGGSSGLSAKSSFVGRASNHHIPSSHKQGSATVRPFIFGRDDSNSRSSMSVSEDSSNAEVPQEIRPTRNITAKYSNSQTKVRSQTTDGGVESISTSTSLLEILKRSSSKPKACNNETPVDFTKSIFGFKVPKKTRVQGRG